VQYTKNELSKLHEFFSYVKNNKLPCDKKLYFLFAHKQKSTFPLILKYLQGNNWICEVAYNELVKHFKWRETCLPVKFNDNLCEAIVFF